MKPTVSIIIPCYNAEAWVAAAIDSCLAQTGASLEVIAINDGSKDGSLAVLRNYESRGVVVVDQPNRGAAAARNAGLAHAQGDYIQFLDADDLLAPDKISRQLARLADAPSDALCSGEWSRFTTDPAEGQFRVEPNWRDLSGIDFMRLHYHDGWMMHPAAWLAPRALLASIGPWDERLTLADDGEYFCRAMLASSGIVFCPGARSYYRSGISGSLSRQVSDRAWRSLFLCVELNVARMLAAEDSARVRRAIADAWQTFVFEAYPSVPELVREAEQRSRAAGAATVSYPAGGLAGILVKLVGWKRVKRLRLWRHGR